MLGNQTFENQCTKKERYQCSRQGIAGKLNRADVMDLKYLKDALVLTKRIKILSSHTRIKDHK